MSIIEQIISGGSDPNATVFIGQWSNGVNYKKNNQVALDGDLYLAIVNHTSAAATEPGTGADWADVWVRQIDSVNADQLAGLAGTDGTPSGTNKYVTSSDSRLDPNDVTGTAGENLAIHTLVYLKSDGKWWKAANNASVIEANCTGITTEAIDADATGAIRVRTGFFTDVGWSWTTGDVLYVGTLGAITATAPTADLTFVKQIGFAVAPTIIYFDPHEGAVNPMFVLNANQFIIDYVPVNYTPAEVAGVTTALDQLSAHIKGIDAKLAGV